MREELNNSMIPCFGNDVLSLELESQFVPASPRLCIYVTWASSPETERNSTWEFIETITIFVFFLLSFHCIPKNKFLNPNGIHKHNLIVAFRVFFFFQSSKESSIFSFFIYSFNFVFFFILCPKTPNGLHSLRIFYKLR